MVGSGYVQLDLMGEAFDKRIEPPAPPLDPKTFWGPAPFGDLPLMSYDLIMADPNWLFELYSEKGEGKAAQSQYECLPTPVLKALPVGDLASRDCVVFLWATWPMLQDAFEVMAAWGFRYVSGGAWSKRTKNGLPEFGTGYRLRNSCDPWLIGVVGNPVTSNAERNYFEGLARGHSRKPETSFAWAERYMPNARRIELFSRQKRKGWDVWGKETDKFPEEGE